MVKKQQDVIVRFPTFQARTIVYKAHGVSLDLAQRRLKLLNEARVMVEGIGRMQFVYADVNCHLRAFTRNGNQKMFNSICDLQIII